METWRFLLLSTYIGLVAADDIGPVTGVYQGRQDDKALCGDTNANKVSGSFSCPDLFVLYGGSNEATCLYFSRVRLDAISAARFCKDKGGTLYVPGRTFADSDTIQDYAFDNECFPDTDTGDRSSYYIGVRARDLSASSIEWEDYEGADFELTAPYDDAFAASPGNEICVVVTADGKWKTDSCNAGRHFFVCQRAA